MMAVVMFNMNKKAHHIHRSDKEFGATVLLEPSDAYQLPRVNVWARADANRAAVLLINSQTENLQPWEMKVILFE